MDSFRKTEKKRNPFELLVFEHRWRDTNSDLCNQTWRSGIYCRTIVCPYYLHPEYNAAKKAGIRLKVIDVGTFMPAVRAGLDPENLITNLWFLQDAEDL